jgi:hypothetical protein
VCGPLGVIGLSGRACQNREMPISIKVRKRKICVKEGKNVINVIEEKVKLGNPKGGE